MIEAKAKLEAARIAFSNCNPMIRHQAGHVLVPILEALTLIAVAVERQDAALHTLAQTVGDALMPDGLDGLEATELSDLPPEFAGQRLVAVD